MSAKEGFRRVKANGLRVSALTVAVAAILAPLGCSCDGEGGGTTKTTGVEEITFFVSNDPDDDQFDYKNPLLIFKPEGAIVTDVVNVSVNTNGAGIPLGSVRHTDTNGNMPSLLGSCPTGVLQPQGSTHQFDNTTVEGEWKVRVCAYAFQLNPPARIALKISWKL